MTAMAGWTLAWHSAVAVVMLALTCLLCMWVTNDYPWRPHPRRRWRAKEGEAPSQEAT